MGQTAEMGTAALAFCWLSLRRCRLVLQCLPPPRGEKNSAAASDFSFQAATKESPPICPGPPCSYWACRRIICSAHPKTAPGGLAPKLPKLPGFHIMLSSAEAFFFKFISVSANSDAAMNASLCRPLPGILMYNSLMCKSNMDLAQKLHSVERSKPTNI